MYASHRRADGRLRAWTITVIAVVVTLGLGTPAHAQPTPQQIEQQINKQWNQLEPVIEQYNRIHTQLQTNRAQQQKISTQLQPLQSGSTPPCPASGNSRTAPTGKAATPP